MRNTVRNYTALILIAFFFLAREAVFLSMSVIPPLPVYFVLGQLAVLIAIIIASWLRVLPAVDCAAFTGVSLAELIARYYFIRWMFGVGLIISLFYLVVVSIRAVSHFRRLGVVGKVLRTGASGSGRK
jgi:hypothetical protein